MLGPRDPSTGGHSKRSRPSTPRGLGVGETPLERWTGGYRALGASARVRPHRRPSRRLNAKLSITWPSQPIGPARLAILWESETGGGALFHRRAGVPMAAQAAGGCSRHQRLRSLAAQLGLKNSFLGANELMLAAVAAKRQQRCHTLAVFTT